MEKERGMMFQTVTYAAQPIHLSVGDFSVGAEGSDFDSAPARPADGFRESHFRENLAAFLFRLAAYFQGYLASLPRLTHTLGYSADGPQAAQAPLTVMDTALDAGHEPLIKVRMNRALTRRLRWLIRRGRVEPSGELRAATVDDEVRCNLSPGQMAEYSLRTYGESRVRAYGLGMGRRLMRLRAILLAALQGDALCLRKTALCAALLSPD